MPPDTELFVGISILIVLAVCGGIVVTLAATIGITVFAMRMIRKAFGPDPGILEHGIPARATIVSARQTGVMVNYQPQVALQLEVHPPGDAPYHVETKAVVPMINIPQFQPGAEVAVKIHPADPTKVVLDSRAGSAT